MSLNYTDANSLRYQLRDLPLPDDVSEARDWAVVAKRIRDRDAFYREHPDLRRKKVS